MAAAAARATQLDSIADNLANSQTPGFKAARPAFAAFLPGKGPTDKVFTAAVATGTDLRPGMAVATDNPLDVLPEGDLFLGVQTASGQVAYTRNGKLEVGSEGQLHIMGHPVLGKSGGPITIPVGSSAVVDDDGQVMADGTLVDSLALFRLQGPMDRQGQALLTPGPGGSVAMVEGRVGVGELEMGNAPALESAVAMISAQRHFETAMQAIQAYKKCDERVVEVGRIK
jgi:flagellar basal-body rod protein FlgF